MPHYEIPQHIRIWIGDRAGQNELDLLPQLRSFEIANPRIDLNGGIHAATGTIKIAGVPTLGWTEDLDPRSNRSRWERGNQIRVQVELSDGTWINHPLGALRLMKRPRPTRGKKGVDLTLSIGDELAYLDANPSPESSSGLLSAAQIVAGVTPTAAINALQSKTSLPTLQDNIAANPLMNGIPTRQSGTRVKQCGAIASAYRNFLWVNGARELRAALCNINRPPDFALDADDYRFEVLDGDLPETDSVTVATTRYVLTQRAAPSADAATDEGLSYSGSIADPFGTPVQTSTMTQPENEVFPTSTSTASITTGSNTKTTYYAGKVFNYSLETQQSCKGLLFPEDFPEDSTLTTAKQVKEQQILTPDGKRVARWVTTEWEPNGLVDPNATDKLALIKTRLIIRIWARHGALWRETTITFDLRERRTTQPSRIGNYPPPQIQVKPEEQEPTEQADSATSEANTDPPKTGSLFRRTYPVFGATQAQELATLKHNLDWGAALPAKWELPITDALITNYHPFLVFDWTDAGVVYRYLSHSHVWLHETNREAIGMAGLFLGTVENGILSPALEVLT
ncbi:MAG: hypothetical protein AAFX78_02055 [Cyanobacteria bacterium J06638_20]